MIIKAASIDTGWDNTLEVWVGSNLIMQRDDSYGLDAQVVFDTTAGTTYTLGLGGYRYTSVGNAWVSFLTGAPSVPVQVAATTTSGEATITWSAPAAAAESVSSFRVQAFRNGVAEGKPVGGQRDPAGHHDPRHRTDRLRELHLHRHRGERAG